MSLLLCVAVSLRRVIVVVASLLQCCVIVSVAASCRCGCDSGRRVAVTAPLFLFAVRVQVVVCMGFTLESTAGGEGIASARSAACKCL